MQRRKRSRKALRILLPLGALSVLAILSVGWEVLKHTTFASMSTGWRHASATLWAAAITGLGCLVVYLVMRRQQQRLSQAADAIRGLIESYRGGGPDVIRYANPHLVPYARQSSRDHDATRIQGEPCWHTKATAHSASESGDPAAVIQECRECPVYRASCPDEVTALGESVNSLAFLLGVEAASVDRMRAQMAERRKMVAIGQIAAGFAHEIRNPLSSISSIVQLLTRKGVDDKARQQLDLIQENVHRMSATVQQLIGLAHPAAHLWEHVDVKKTVEEAVRLIESDPRAQKVDIRVECAHPLSATFALRVRLQQVFVNLLVNALDSMPDGGQLNIQLQERSQDIAVAFADTGCGIDPELGRRIFEPFFTTKEPGRGAGLGLSVCYTIVEEHGGRIDVQPREGRGAVLTVELPILTRPPEPVLVRSRRSEPGRVAAAATPGEPKPPARMKV